MSTPKNMAVIGAGLMGHGIALTLARAGHSVTVSDPATGSLQSLHQRIGDSLAGMGVEDDETAATLTRVDIAPSLEAAVAGAWMVTEAAPEKMALKQSLFAEIEAHAPADCLLASNTSVMPITEIMKNVKDGSRALGTHWWNPPHLIPLVEVIATSSTCKRTVDSVVDVLEDAGKTAVRVAKDVPGFIGNRLQHALWREAVSLVERGICDARAVDAVVKASFGRRLAVLGPLENADLVGTDLTLDIHERVLEDLEHRPGPSPYLRELVEQGRLGMKSGQGFRDWTDDEANSLRRRVVEHLKRLDTILYSEGEEQ